MATEPQPYIYILFRHLRALLRSISVIKYPLFFENWIPILHKSYSPANVRLYMNIHISHRIRVFDRPMFYSRVKGNISVNKPQKRHFVLAPKTRW